MFNILLILSDVWLTLLFFGDELLFDDFVWAAHLFLSWVSKTQHQKTIHHQREGNQDFKATVIIPYRILWKHKKDDEVKVC